MAGEREEDFAPDDTVMAALKLLGAPAEVLENTQRGAGGERHFEYWKDTEDAVLFMLGVFHQWQFSGGMSPMRVALNYQALDVVRRARGIKGKRWSSLFADIQIMERAALDVFYEKAEREAASRNT